MMKHNLELLNERETVLKERIARRELESSLDRVDLRILQVERAYILTHIAFHAKIPMDKIKDMVVTKDGVMMKGRKDARPVLLHSGDNQGAREAS
jgi:hypothetical protein